MYLSFFYPCKCLHNKVFDNFNPCSGDGFLIMRPATMLVLGKQKKEKISIFHVDYLVQPQGLCLFSVRKYCCHLSVFVQYLRLLNERPGLMLVGIFLFLPGIYGWAFRLPLRNCARVSLSLFACCFTILMCWGKSAKWSNVIQGNLNELVQLSHKILVIMFILEDKMNA